MPLLFLVPRLRFLASTALLALVTVGVTLPAGAQSSTGAVSAHPAPPDETPSAHPADVRFMQGMIPHHAQALEMTSLVRSRTDNRAMLLLAERIEVSQRDEIAWMQRWLRTRGAELPPIVPTIPLTASALESLSSTEAPGPATPAATACTPEHAAMGHCTPAAGSGQAGMGHAGMGHGGMNHSQMPGMLSSEQMADLAAATGDAFVRRFLVYMTRHHEGALTMVTELFATPGGGQATEVYHYATDVDGDQRADIRRMAALLATLPPAPPSAAHH